MDASEGEAMYDIIYSSTGDGQVHKLQFKTNLNGIGQAEDELSWKWAPKMARKTIPRYRASKLANTDWGVCGFSLF